MCDGQNAPQGVKVVVEFGQHEARMQVQLRTENAMRGHAPVHKMTKGKSQRWDSATEVHMKVGHAT